MVTLSFGSFPRSANHFTFAVLEQVFGEGNVATLLHSINLLEKSTNTISTIRTPIECVPSWITFNNDRRPGRTSRILEWYCAYYQAALKKDLLLFRFEDITNRTESCLQLISELYEIPKIGRLEIDLSTGFHAPTLDKSSFSELEDEVKSSNNFSDAMSIFDACLSKCAILVE